MSDYTLRQQLQLIPLIAIACVLTASTYLGLWVLGVFSLGVDDAFSYQVYAKNLLNHGELVFNPDVLSHVCLQLLNDFFVHFGAALLRSCYFTGHI